MRHKNPLKNAKNWQHCVLPLAYLGGAILALAITFATQLYWEQIASRPPQLSEAIPLTLDEKQQVHIPIEQVKDGKITPFCLDC